MDNKDQKKSLFDKFFNLDEFKNISLVAALFVSLGFGIYFCFTDKDIPQNLSLIILTLVGAISGASLVGIVSNSIASRNNNQYMSQYSGVNSNYQNYDNNNTNTQYQSSPYNSPSVNPISDSPIVNSNSGDNTDPSQRPI